MSITKKNMSEEKKKKLSNSHKGKHHSEETRKKISEAIKNMSEEAKHKMYEYRKFGHWFNNGIAEVFVKECPEGFVKGRLKKVKQI